MEDPTSQRLHQHNDDTQVQLGPAANSMNANKALQNNSADIVTDLPLPEPWVFTGDPLNYPSWKASFDTLINTKGVMGSERIHYLRKYLGGETKSVVEGTFYLKSEEAYERAVALLEKRYGNSFVVAEAFRDKLQAFPKIPSRDNKALRRFSDLLQQTLVVMDQIKGLEILNDCRENKRLLEKLPDWLLQRWTRIVADHHTAYPSFERFADFITTEADIACHPVTSTLTSNQRRQDSPERRNMGNRTLANISQANDKPFCLLCKKSNHDLHNCFVFKKNTPEERKIFLMKSGICFGCLSHGHKAKDCKKRSTCERCNKKHPTCHHGDYEALKTNNAEKNNQASSITNQDSRHNSAQVDIEGASHKTSQNTKSLKTSMIVPVYLSTTDKPYEEHLTYAMLDTQSDTTFVLEETSLKLNTKSEPSRLKLSTMTSTETIECRRFHNLQIRGLKSLTKIPLSVTYSREFIPAYRSHIPTCETAKQWAHLQGLESEIPPDLQCEVGLLIGYNCPQALAPKDHILGRGNEPFAQQTELGWSIVGRISAEDDGENVDSIGLSHKIITRKVPESIQISGESPEEVHFMCKARIKEEMVTPQVVKLLEADFPDRRNEEKTMSQEDKQFMKIVENGIHKDEEGYYEIPLPFKREMPALPNNKAMAEKRLTHLKRRLICDPKLYQDYKAFMEQIIQNGDAEEINNEKEPTNAWYIPHHGVYHSKKPNKIRIVFDCSARYKGVALNDYLLQGPDLLNSMVGVLIRFREDPIAIMGDIEKMFHKFKVNEEHRDYLRFLWWESGNLESQPRSYRMKVHLFCATSSPGCANYGLKKLAIDNQNEFGKEATHFLLNDFYVDDGLTSCKNVAEAIQLIETTRQICAKANIRLHKLVSNHPEVLQSIPESERSETETLNINLEEVTIERALGIQWCIVSDEFHFRVTLAVKPKTRRGILSTVASIFDPMGYIAPFTLIGKQILEDMCRENVGWDDPLSEDLATRWNRWLDELPALADIKIQRHVAPKEFGDIVSRELHHFSDASFSGYGQCSYLRIVNARGEVFCTLIMGKSRVTPMKTITIPRLELTAALVSVKIRNLLISELKHTVTREVFWTDSKITLGYINNDAKRFHVFVANRVQQIKESTKANQWRHVPSSKNPADSASRGLLASELERSTWLSGPKFLWDIELPSNDSTDISLSSDDPEVKKVIVNATKTSEATDVVLKKLEKFSRWSSAISAINLLRRTCYKGRDSYDPVKHRHESEMLIIKKLQKVAFSEEIQRLDNLPKGSKLFKLDPFIDENGVLRVGGRLKLSSMPFEVKHPAILPKSGHISELIIRHYHERVQHQGRGFTTTEIRSHGYWIVGMNRAVSSVIHKCVQCRQLRGSLNCQKMANLSEDRTEAAAPFTYCGMDCFGPFIVKDGRREVKRYGLLLTCFSSRAVHIEMLDDMSTDALINGLRCFVSLRGPARSIRCDRGTNFVGASHKLKQRFNELSDDRVKQFLMKHRCDFLMNVPHACHMGGVWERQIRTVRSILSSLMLQHASRLDSASLRTFFYEAMAIVNSRPLTTDNLNVPDGPEPLTPNHLITMKSGVILPPPGNFEKEDLYSRKRWKRVQFLANQFWNRFKREYQAQQQRQKWNKTHRNVKLGDIVVLHDDGLFRGHWRMGKVIETVVDEDKLVRKVKVLIGDKHLSGDVKRLSEPSVLERPIHKLTVLVESL